MRVETINKGVYIFYDVFSENDFLKIKDLVFNKFKYNKLNYSGIDIDSLKNYNLEVFYFSDYPKLRQNFLQILWNKIEYIRKFAENAYNEKLEYSNMEGIFKMNKGGRIGEHTDESSTIQGVIYFANGDTSGLYGGNLSIFVDGVFKTVYVKENSIIIFRGKTIHSVSKYLGDIPRYSMPFGFDNIENKIAKKRDGIMYLKNIVEK